MRKEGTGSESGVGEDQNGFNMSHSLNRCENKQLQCKFAKKHFFLLSLLKTSIQAGYVYGALLTQSPYFSKTVTSPTYQGWREASSIQTVFSRKLITDQKQLEDTDI